MIEETKSININFWSISSEFWKEYPVATTGLPINVMYEIVYMIEKLNRKYEPTPDFNIFYEQHLADNWYYLLTLILVFFRFRKNIFYNKIFMNEVKMNELFFEFNKIISNLWYHF